MMRAGDIVLVLLCAALAGSAWALAWPPGGTASTVELRVPGEPPRRLVLDHSREITVQGRDGASRIALRPGGARFLASPCNGKQCIHAGWLERAGDFAACLPNGVSLTLSGGEHGYDGIGY